jgi:hypothetical protein
MPGRRTIFIADSAHHLFFALAVLPGCQDARPLWLPYPTLIARASSNSFHWLFLLGVASCCVDVVGQVVVRLWVVVRAIR